MTIKVDPEENEIGALFDFVDLDGARVLEIGSGDCRLTWRYGDRVEQVTAVEPFAPAITRARQHLPQELERQVVLRQAAFAEFAAQAPTSAFDVAIFSWSLCCVERDLMVPALEEAHRLLGPSGTLIDIHPVFGTARVEVHCAGQVVFAEPASASPDEGVLQADEALAHVVARGLFVSERHREFDFRVYGSSGDELGDFLCRGRRALEPRLRGAVRYVHVRAVRAGGPHHGWQIGRGGSRLPRTGADYSAETRDHVSRGAAARHRGNVVMGMVRAVVELDRRSLAACTGVPT
jgi:SAM-dependent methyltransferase